MANPIAGPAASLARARPEAFLLTILAPMYNEETSVGPLYLIRRVRPPEDGPGTDPSPDP